jgi:transcriptional regulator with GAF, ATPase, and Fis domain
MNTTSTSSLPPRVNLKATLLSMERTLIHSALIACDWNQRKAASALGVQPTTLSQKMQRLKLRPPVDRWASRRGLADAQIAEGSGA